MTSHYGLPSKCKDYLNALNFTGINVPYSLKYIDKFEQRNPENKLNTFGYEKGIYVLRRNKTDPRNAIDLLSISNEENQHHCWIKNSSALVPLQVT